MKRRAPDTQATNQRNEIENGYPRGTSNNDIIIQQPVLSDNDDQDNDDQSSVSSENVAPSPKRQNQKRTPPRFLRHH